MSATLCVRVRAHAQAHAQHTHGTHTRTHKLVCVLWCGRKKVDVIISHLCATSMLSVLERLKWNMDLETGVLCIISLKGGNYSFKKYTGEVGEGNQPEKEFLLLNRTIHCFILCLPPEDIFPIKKCTRRPSPIHTVGPFMKNIIKYWQMSLLNLKKVKHIY